MKIIKKRLKWKNVFLLIFLFINAIFLSISITKFIIMFVNSKNSKNNFNKITEIVEIQEVTNTDNVEIINSSENKNSPYWKYVKMNLIDVDFTELKKINSSTIGWIQVGGTNINYPFVQTDNNDFYLKHSFDNSYNEAGWIFLDFRNNLIDDKNTIIYGHSMKDKTMFGTLRNVLSSSWINNTDNHIVKISTETKNSLWQVFSVYHIPTTTDYLQTSFISDKTYLDFLNMIKDRSTYLFNTSINENDRIITLSSCYNDTDKIVLHAKLIKIENK